MIADDTNAIRDAMRKLAQAKVQAEAEAARRAANDDTTVNLSAPKPLFSDECPPFRGFFLTEDGKPDSNFDFDADAWDDWQRGEWDNVSLESGITENATPRFMWGTLDP